MDRAKLLKIVAGILIGVFILQYSSMLISSYLKDSSKLKGQNPIQNYQYKGLVNMTIDYYERELLSSNLDYENMQLLKQDNRVKDVALENGTYKISLKKKEYVNQIYSELNKKNISSYAIAKLITQPSISIQIPNEENITNAYFYSRKIKFGPIKPIFKVGSEITIYSDIVLYNSQAYIVGNMQIHDDPKQITVNAVVENKSRIYKYIIPWENNSIDLDYLYTRYGEENVIYSQKNNIKFQNPLTVDEQINKKYDYITFINENSATINSTFRNKTKVLSDFGNVTFENSTLMIMVANIEDDIQFDSLNGSLNNSLNGFEETDYQMYKLKIYGGNDYYIPNEIDEQSLIISDLLSINESVNVTMDTLITGNNILKINKIGLD